MLIFALLAAGLGSSTQTEAKEQGLVVVPRDNPIEPALVPPTRVGTQRYFFDKRFEKSPGKRSFMVITPPPSSKQFGERQEGSQWLEPPDGGVAPGLKTKPYLAEPVKEPVTKIRALRGGGH
jgi:hypothetical protein